MSAPSTEETRIEQLKLTYTCTRGRLLRIGDAALLTQELIRPDRLRDKLTLDQCTTALVVLRAHMRDRSTPLHPYDLVVESIAGFLYPPDGLPRVLCDDCELPHMPAELAILAGRNLCKLCRCVLPEYETDEEAYASDVEDVEAGEDQ